MPEKTNGNGDAMSWLFRIAILLVGGCGSYILYGLDNSTQRMWQQISKFGDTINAIDTTIAKIDARHASRDIQIQGINGQLIDHENRIRGLEVKTR